jgi:hypothetical protein
MVHIVTEPAGNGNTTRLNEIFQPLGGSGGFPLVKH